MVIQRRPDGRAEIDGLDEVESVIGASVIGRTVTDTLRVHSNGDNSDGSTWAKAYNQMQNALIAADPSPYACTLVLVTPRTGTDYYDIYAPGDPTFSKNVIIAGTHRNWAKVMNTHPLATSIMKLTGRASVINLNINLGTGNNGLILTGGGGRVRHCQFVGEDLTVPATALWCDTDSAKHHKVYDCDFYGHVTHMTAFLVDQLGYSEFEYLRIHKSLVGVHFVGVDADSNLLYKCDIGDCAKAIKIDAGNHQHFQHITLHDNTLNVEDAAHDHIWDDIRGEFKAHTEPDNLVGVQVNCGAAGVYGGDTEIRAAGSSTKPFRVIGYGVAPTANEWYALRFSADNGATFFDTVMFDGNKQQGVSAPSGTEFIFNIGTRISGSARSITGGNNVKVWLEVQEI